MTARDIVERCLGEKMFGGHFVDFDPLVKVMGFVTEVIGAKRLGDNPKARRVWVKVVAELQATGDLEHNRLIPCRYCDTAFEPVIGDQLLNLALAWHSSYATVDLLAIHRCPDCGGVLKGTRSEKYHGDHFTPAPGTIADDEAWASALLNGPGPQDDLS